MAIRLLARVPIVSTRLRGLKVPAVRAPPKLVA
jgi:hypothetical protein